MRVFKHGINKETIGRKGYLCKIKTILLFLFEILVTKALLRILFGAALAFALPQGANVVTGNVVVTSPNSSTVLIKQGSDKAIIDWNSFNIGAKEKTQFIQPSASSTALNRINPQQGASQIYGQLTANGQIILINGAGIYFGPSAYVNVGGIIASTADITNQNFLNGNYHFLQALPYSGSIINEGQIIAVNHGLVALIGASVSNTGLIQANLGQVVLASGSTFTMSFVGNDMIAFSVDQKSLNAGVDQNGKPLPYGVSNAGTLRANGGQILVTAQAAQGVLDNVIDMQGVAIADSVGMQQGQIIISGSGGSVNVSGKLIASGKRPGESGGTVKVLGTDVALVNNASIDVSGNAGGGTVLIGGNAHGAGPELNADYSFIGRDVTIDANALMNGNGGRVVVWSDLGTQFYGNISVQGGITGGNGGWVETSSKNYLDVNGGRVNALAPFGITGTWLLDPTNIYIATSQATATTAGMTGTDVTANTGSGGDPNTFAATGAAFDSLLLTGNLTTALGTANVIVTTTNPTGTGLGNITVVNAFSWASANTLTLTAANNITINGAITTGAAGSALILNAVGNVTQSAVIGGAGGLTQQGAGLLTLSQANTYTGATTISSGSVSVTNATGLGAVAGAVSVAAGATLDINGVVVGAKPITINGTGIGNGALTGTGTSSLSGIVTLGSDSSIGENTGAAFTLSGGITGTTQNLTLTGIGTGTESGAITTTSGALTKIGLGTWILGSAVNSYAGGTSVNGGTLSVGTMALSGSNSGIGTGALSIDTGGIFSYTGTNVTTNRAITVGSGGGTLQALNAVSRTLTLTGGISNAGALTLDTSGVGPGNITVTTTAISGGGSLTKTGPGTLILGVADIYTGATMINGGSISLTNLNGLGSGATQSSSTIVASGANLDMSFVTATLGNTNSITLNGTGVGGTGALTGSATTDTLSNAISLAGNTTIGGAKTMILNGIISDGGGAFSLTKTGANTITLNGVNTYSGGTTVAGTGTLTITIKIA